MYLEFYILSSSFMLYFQLSNIPENNLMEKNEFKSSFQNKIQILIPTLISPN